MSGANDYSQCLPFFPELVRPHGKSWFRDRIAAIAVIIGVHVFIVLALIMQMDVLKIATQNEPSPLIVNLFEAPTHREELTPAVLRFEPSALLTVIAPEIAIAEDPASTATMVTDSHTSPEAAAAMGTQQAVIEARFDADYLNNQQPAYPSVSRRMREQGLVVLKVKVRADGAAAMVLVQQRSGSIRLDQAAIAAVKHWKFVPAKRGDQQIESWVLVPIEFELKA